MSAEKPKPSVEEMKKLHSEASKINESVESGELTTAEASNNSDLSHQEDESLPEISSLESITLRNFWQGVVSGSYEPLNDEEIEHIVDQQFERYPEMTSLSEAEKEAIREHFAEHIRRVSNYEKRKCLAENPLALTEHNGHPTIVDLLTQRFDVDLESLQPLSKAEKVKLLSDYTLYEEGVVVIYKHILSQLESQGSGGIDSYWLNNEDISTIMTRIRNRRNGQHLRVLDVGGMTGRALHNIKQMDNSAETYNLTIDEDPAMYPVDHLLLCPAEHMPKDLEGKIDLVISSISFRYHTLPDISLRNAIKALSEGGEAFIEFETERSSWRSRNPEDFRHRIKRVFDWIKSLEDNQEIEANFVRSSRNIGSPDTDEIAKIAKGGGILLIHIVKTSNK